jgi:hypothetical protein
MTENSPLFTLNSCVGITSADNLKLDSVDNHRFHKLALFQTSKVFEDCLSANMQVSSFRLMIEWELARRVMRLLAKIVYDLS